MTSEDQVTTSAIDEELVAYLDGELDGEATARVERRLADDAAYRARLAQHQRAWDMLDRLHRSEADDDFARSTVAMVAIRASDDARTGQMQAIRRRSFAWVAVAAAALVAATTAYGVVQYKLSQPNRELVHDLPVIERMDDYRTIQHGGVEFLERLQEEGLFAPELNDAQQN